jgi:Trypsin
LLSHLRARFCVASALVALGVLCALSVPVSAAGPTANGSIAGGYYPHPSAWPWTTALVDPTQPAIEGDFGRGFCTAVLISPTRVLTAAHCVEAPGSEGRAAQDPTRVQALVGRRNLKITNQGERANVTGIALHPKAWLPKSGPHQHHAFYDIAVLFLDHAVSITPATIGTPSDWNSSATVMGFGHWNYNHDDPQNDEYLRAADFDTVNDADCAAAVNYGHTGQHYFPNIHVCTNNAPGPNVDCVTHGDSGGPMMIQTTAGWRLIGITSFYPQRWSDRCGAGGPFGFAWVAGAEMRNWPLTVPHPAMSGGGGSQLDLTMTITEVRRYIRTMIRDNTSGRIRGLRGSCSRTDERGFRCRLGWRIRRHRFNGQGAFWHYQGNGTAYWTYTFSGKRRACGGCRATRLMW